LTFFTDKGSNNVCQYDFWAINIFTSLGLSLKMVIFRFFCAKFWGLLWPGKKFHGQKIIKKYRLFLNPTSANSCRLYIFREIQKAVFGKK
jgi:hypothetical protein